MVIEKQILFSIDDAIREVSEVLGKDHQTEMFYVNLGQIIALYATKDIINRQIRYSYEDRMDGDEVGLIDADALIKRLQDEAAMIMSEDNFGKDRQRLARGVLRAADIVMEMEADDG